MRPNIVPDKYFPEGIEEKITPAQKIVRGIGLTAIAVLTMVILGFFSASPPYHHLTDDEAMIKVSLSHEGKRLVPCVNRTREELMKLAPNMRAAKKCSRERTPVLLVVQVDGNEIFRQTAKPNGLSSDGASIFYQKLVVPTGEHKITVLMRDSLRDEGFDYKYDDTVHLENGRNFVITFDENNHDFKVY